MRQAVGPDETAGRPVHLGVFPGDPHRWAVDVGADRQPRARARRGDGQHAGAGADVQHLGIARPLQKRVVGQEATDGGAMVASAERGSCLDPQVHRVDRRAAPVVHAIDEEATGPHRRQARQGHRQPVRVSQLFDHDTKLVVACEKMSHPLGLRIGRREGVHPPEALVLVFFDDRKGHLIQNRRLFHRGRGGFGDAARAAGDDLYGLIGHARLLGHRPERGKSRPAAEHYQQKLQIVH